MVYVPVQCPDGQSTEVGELVKETAPPRHADSLAPGYRRGRPLRLRAGGLQRRATAPPRRRTARGALRFSGDCLKSRFRPNGL